MRKVIWEQSCRQWGEIAIKCLDPEGCHQAKSDIVYLCVCLFSNTNNFVPHVTNLEYKVTFIV